MPLKGSSLELCKKAFARQRAKDLTEQASALLAKDKQIEALQQECRELQAKLLAGKVRHFVGHHSRAGDKWCNSSDGNQAPGSGVREISLKWRLKTGQGI